MNTRSALLTAHQRLEVDLASRVAAEQAVPAKQPEVAAARDRRTGRDDDCVVSSIAAIGIGLARFVDHEVDFGEAEPGQLDIELEVDQRLQLDGEDLLVPPGIERELVVGQHVGAPLGLGEMRQRDGRHRLPFEQLGRFDPAVAGDDLAIVGDKHRVGEPEPLDRRGDLLDLLLGMRARVARIRTERGDRPLDRCVQFPWRPSNRYDQYRHTRLNAGLWQSVVYDSGILG